MSTADHVVETSMIGALVRGYWYDAASTLLDRTLNGELSGNSCGSETVTPNRSALSNAQQLAAAARRVLDLDAEDFACRSWSRQWLAGRSWRAGCSARLGRTGFGHCRRARRRDELRSR
jgi:hypothetical protein